MIESPKEIYQEMVRAGFDPIKGIIERDDLDEVLTNEDIQKVCHAVEKWLVNYIEFLKIAKRQIK